MTEFGGTIKSIYLHGLQDSSTAPKKQGISVYPAHLDILLPQDKSYISIILHSNSLPHLALHRRLFPQTFWKKLSLNFLLLISAQHHFSLHLLGINHPNYTRWGVGLQNMALLQYVPLRSKPNYCTWTPSRMKNNKTNDNIEFFIRILSLQPMHCLKSVRP